MNEPVKTFEVRVLFFATLKERAGVKEILLSLDEGTTVRELKQMLLMRFPVLKPALKSVVVSVNRQFAFDDEPVPENAEVALFPPVSGGSTGGPTTLIRLAEQPFSLDEILAEITNPSTGAACFFTGLVRAATTRGEAHQTVFLEYEAYQAMAEAKMQQVADEIRFRWPTVEGIAIFQRTGVLYPGSPTVLIACSTAHRDTGVFEAARYGIDRLKEIVPVWKKEVGPNGEVWVEGSYLPGDQDR